MRGAERERERETETETETERETERETEGETEGERGFAAAAKPCQRGPTGPKAVDPSRPGPQREAVRGRRMARMEGPAATRMGPRGGPGGRGGDLDAAAAAGRGPGVGDDGVYLSLRYR